jgi:hypothetical protein
MKPIFCTDITVNKNNTEINGTEFISRSISEEKRAEMDARANELQRMISQARLPGWMVTLRSIAGFASLIMAMNLMNVVLDKGFTALFAQDQIMGTTICLCAVAAWFYLSRLGRMKVQSMENDPQIKTKNNELEIEIALMMYEMGVPTNAKSMDILVFNYKTKDGEIIPTTPMMMPSIFMNFECKVYSDGDTICLADSDSVYAFNKSDIKMLRKVDSKATVYSWNKQDNPTDPKYAACGVSLNKMGMATADCYYVVEIEKNGEIFGLYVPGYEAEILREVFGFETALDADGDMATLPCYVEDEDNEDDVAELSAPEEETTETVDDVAELATPEETLDSEEDSLTDDVVEPEEAEEEEIASEHVEENLEPKEEEEATQNEEELDKESDVEY